MRRSMSSWRASSGEGRSALLALLLAAACTTKDARPTPPPAPAVQATLVISADVKGYLGPCGCSQNMRGGLSRAAQQLQLVRQEGHPVFFVDSGDGLFGATTLPPEAVPQQERKAKALAAGWKAMGLATRAVGPFDDARGAAFREALGLPETKAGRFTTLDAQGHRLAVVSAGDVAEARRVGLEARRSGARFVVAFVPRPFELLLRETAEATEVDLFVSSKPKDELAAEESRFGGLGAKVAQLQSKGRALLRVDVHLRGEGPVAWPRGDAERERELRGLDQRIELLRAQVNEPMLGEELKALRRAKLEEIIARREALAAEPLPLPEAGNAATARFLPLESTLPKHPEVEALERAYDVDVGLLNLEWAKANGQSCEPATPERPGLIGTPLCIACHVEAGAVWQATKHPKAYEGLKAQGKQHHLDCVGCHVTGWRQPQGVCRIDETAGREEVGCESCHGPGSAHLANPVKGTIARPERKKEVCVGCHDLENSPHFDFDTWLPKVLGPGHGLPKAAR